jgi:RNA polymerase sigma-70 factor (ECF subfamily)
MVRRVAGRLAPESDAADLVQETFAQAIEGLGSIRNPDLFSAWLISIVRNLAQRSGRRRALAARQHDSLSAEDLVFNGAPPDAYAELSTLSKIVECLPRETGQAFVLRRIERMSIKEVASRLGRSVATVKRRLKRAERSVSRWLAGDLRPRRRPTHTAATPRTAGTARARSPAGNPRRGRRSRSVARAAATDGLESSGV